MSALVPTDPQKAFAAFLADLAPNRERALQIGLERDQIRTEHQAGTADCNDERQYGVKSKLAVVAQLAGEAAPGCCEVGCKHAILRSPKRRKALLVGAHVDVYYRVQNEWHCGGTHLVPTCQWHNNSKTHEKAGYKCNLDPERVQYLVPFRCRCGSSKPPAE